LAILFLPSSAIKKGELKVIGKPKKPDDIPASPDGTYKKKGWLNWGDWLGTNAKPRKRV
jgi:hypothetical protein